MTSAIIHADHLSKRFGRTDDRPAVADVSIDVAAGEVVALLGPNGAGKTTLFRMLATLLRPTSGTATIGGADVRKHPTHVRRLLGYVPQSSPTPTRALSVSEELVFACRLQGFGKAEAMSRASEVSAVFGMTELSDADVRRLSGGQRRRLEIALGVVHEPRVLLLDEPTTGLDPDAREDVWHHLLRLRERADVSVLISTHYLDEADFLADQLVALNRGQVITRGTPRALKRSLAADVIAIHVDPSHADRWPLNALRTLPDVRTVKCSNDQVVVTASDASILLAPIVENFASRSATVTSISVERANLRDVFTALIDAKEA